MERRVARADLDALLKRIEREGSERLVSAVPDGDDIVVTTEPRETARQETR